MLGDFNPDLLKIDKHDDLNHFYNVLTSQSFRLQHKRVTTTSATLDNIFIDNMAKNSSGGNITNHLSQFPALNIEPTKLKIKMVNTFL